MLSINGAPNLRGEPNLVGMREWLQLLGHSELLSDSLLANEITNLGIF